MPWCSKGGVEDLVGNVWQWTDEYVDDHTRAAILRGGSFYRPQGSRWYFPQAYELTAHGSTCSWRLPSIGRVLSDFASWSMCTRETRVH